MAGDELQRLFDRPISDRARSMLRALRTNKRLGRVRGLVALEEFETASECQSAGYARILPDECSVVITGLGQSYLDSLMRSL